MSTEKRKIASHRISFSDEQIEEILGKTETILRSGQVILGDRTREFEEAYAAACGRQYGVAVGSDTAAFEMQLKTIAGPSGNLDGRKVLYPALAFPSILESVRNAGGQPWFIDGDWDGHLFARLDHVKRSVEQCVEATGEPPIALILMHTGGLVARDSREISDWCSEMGIDVLEDAAHSFGAEVYGSAAGSFGVSSAFSLYATKPMHACEGGMIVTDDADLADECKVYRNYGRTQDFGRSVIVRHGYSWRMTEIQAVIGLSNLQNIGPNVARRREIMATYDKLLADNRIFDTIGGLECDPSMKPNGYRYLLLLPEGWSAADRLKMKQEVSADFGIDLPGEVYELPSHTQPIWRGEFGHLSMPMAEEFCERHFALPVYPDLTDDDLEYIVDSVGTALKRRGL